MLLPCISCGGGTVCFWVVVHCGFWPIWLGTWLLLLASNPVARNFNQTKTTSAQSIDPPIPAPTPIAIFEVCDISEGDDDAVAELDVELVTDGDATFDIMASVEVDVDEVVEAVVVVDEGLVILKKLEVKPFGPSGFIQRKKTFE